ncbi:MAG TPA: hypothetical protein VGD10_00350 [Allosphingosinicella sp.]|uniref:hypothetical protein n=1 Tax=Allosphingosinicella sp. TaxID=2823234 RepID=UPI002EDAC00C
MVNQQNGSTEKDGLVSGSPGGTSGTAATENTGSGAGAGAAGPADESLIGRRGGEDDTGGLAGAHEAGEVPGREESRNLGTAIPQSDPQVARGPLADDEGEAAGGTDTIEGADAIGRGSPSAGDPGGMGGSRAGLNTHGRPPGGVSPMDSSRSEDEGGQR